MTISDVLSNLATGRGSHVQGVLAGVVSDNHDPDGLGRVKLRFPWLGDEVESGWAKVVSLMAGKERGAVFLPEVGDEVLVAFEQGNFDHPYVLGGLWNSEDPPPESNADGKNNVRKIRSRRGHEITFRDDQSGADTKVEIRTSAGHLIVLDDSNGSEKIEIADNTGSNSIRMDSTSGTVSLQSLTKIEIKSQVVEIQAQATMKLSAGATMEIQGGLVKIN